MIAGLGLTIDLYALVIAVACLIAAVRNRARPVLVVPGLIVLELALGLQVVLDALSVGSHRPVSLATHLGYLLTSVIVLPGTAASTRLDNSRWGSAALATGAVVTAVVSLRLHQTLGPERG